MKLAGRALHSGVSAAERARALPGDDVVPGAAVVIDRATTLAASPEQVWPWIVQLGKDRGGWYLPGWLERVLPASGRGLRRIEQAYSELAVGDEVPDWGPKHHGVSPVYRVVFIEAPHALVYVTERPRKSGDPLVFSWAHVLTPVGPGTRLHLRLRINQMGTRAPQLVGAAVGLFDEATVRPMFAGLAERLR